MASVNEGNCAETKLFGKIQPTTPGLKASTVDVTKDAVDDDVTSASVLPEAVDNNLVEVSYVGLHIKISNTEWYEILLTMYERLTTVFHQCLTGVFRLTLKLFITFLLDWMQFW